MDLREASLQMNSKITSTSEKEIARLFNYEINADHMFITLGSKGSLYTNGEQIVHQASYKSEIVDTIGAGDTFYAFCTLLSAVNPTLKILLFLHLRLVFLPPGCAMKNLLHVKVF